MSSEPIRIFVGAVHSHRLLFEVLRWSIRRSTRRAVEVLSLGELLGDTLVLPKRPENRPGTPFSFQRFAIPMLAGGRGRAIYVDSDQILLRDIAEMYELPMRFGAKVLRRTANGPDGKLGLRGSSVMLMHCERLRDWSPQRIADDLDAGRYRYVDLMKLRPLWLKGSLPREWNAFDLHEPGRTCLLHYTSKEQQPWLSRGHPFEALWFEALYSGLDAGSVSQDAVDFSLAQGYVRPSLAWQITHRALDSRLVPSSLHAADDAFLDHCRQHNFNNLDGDYRLK
ncbi:MAG: hypothetical protein CFE40_01675 [Burkholderiales bacterium PBB1]|nr:MAG: hypothetical protein CFE40_01675 [Burkholderiales bacterium PBB1]